MSTLLMAFDRRGRTASYVAAAVIPGSLAAAQPSPDPGHWFTKVGQVVRMRLENASSAVPNCERPGSPSTGEAMHASPGHSAFRAGKVRFYEDGRLASRNLPLLMLPSSTTAHCGGRRITQANAWTSFAVSESGSATMDGPAAASFADHDRANHDVCHQSAFAIHTLNQRLASQDVPADIRDKPLLLPATK